MMRPAALDCIMPGYEADVEEELEDEDSEQGRPVSRLMPLEANESRKRTRHESRCSRKKLRKPIHPDIDLTLTELVSSDDFDRRKEKAAAHHRKAPSPRELHSMLVDVLAEAAPKSSEEDHLVEPSSSASSNTDSRSTSSASPPPPTFNTSTILRQPGQARSTDNGNSLGRLTYSNHVYLLKEAMDLSPQARLLIEAHPPYQVVHVNAAFLRQIGAAAPTPTMSLRNVIRTHIGDRAATVFAILPDQGERVSHYMVEPAVPTIWKDPDHTAQVVG